MKRILIIGVLIFGVASSWGQDVNYVLYRTTNSANAYYNHLKTGCSATITSVPISIDWSMSNGTELSSSNCSLLGSFSTTDNCTSRSTIGIGCDLSEFEGGVRYLVEFDNNSGTTTKTLRNANDIVIVTTTSSYANGSFTVGITPQRPVLIFKCDSYLENISPQIFIQDELAYICTNNDKVTFPNSNYTYQIDWRANSSDTWKTITSYPFKVPYSVLKDTSDEGKYIYLRSRIIRSTEGVVDGTSPLEVKRKDESLNITTETIPTTDDPVKYSPYSGEISVEVRAKPEIKIIEVDSLKCKSDLVRLKVQIGKIVPNHKLLMHYKTSTVPIHDFDIKTFYDTNAYHSQYVTINQQIDTGSFKIFFDYKRLMPSGEYVTITGSDTTINIALKKVKPITLTATIKKPIKCNGEMGIVILTAKEGTNTGYTYSINGGGFDTTKTFQLKAGVYSFSVQDCNQNAATISFKMPEPTKLTLKATPIDVKCKGENTGGITASALGGTSPYLYTSFKGGVRLDSNINGTFSNYTAEIYSVKVRDKNGCIDNIPLITVSQPKDSLTLVVNKYDNVKCFGNSDGSVTLQASGGNSGYSYSLDQSTWTTNSTISGLVKNSYTFSVQDVKGCKADVTQIITQPNQLTLKADSIFNLTCYKRKDGEVKLSASGGTKDYQFSKDGQNWQPDSVFSFLDAKTYKFSIKDFNACADSVNVNVTQPDSLKLKVRKYGDVLCYGGNTGYVTLEATGGTLPYTYSNGGYDWTSNTTFNELYQGKYVFKVKDKNECDQNLKKDISQPSILSASTSKVDVSCNGGTNGSITVTAKGGTPPYYYSKDNGENFVEASSPYTFVGLVSAGYQIVVKDKNNCITNAINTFVSQPLNPLSATASSVNVKCNGDKNGEITFTASEGTSPYSYSIDNGISFSDSSQFTELIPATYQLVVKDNNGCMIYLAPITITQPSASLSATYSHRDIFCYGAKDGEITINTAGGTSPYRYSKDNGYTFTDLSGSVPYHLTGLDAATYQIVVRDTNGCVTSPVEVSIVQPSQEYKFSISNAVNVKCFGGNDGSVELKAEGGTPFTGNSYLYSMDGRIWSVSSNTFRFDALVARSDTFRVQDSNGCKLSVIHAVTQPDNINPNASIANVVCKGESNGAIHFTVSGGTPIYSLDLFTSSKTIGSLSNVSTKVGFTGLNAQTYKLKVTDNAGCVKIDSFKVQEPSSSLGFTVSSTQPKCKGLANGSLEISASGGWDSYSYSDSLTSNNSGVFTGLTAGKYKLSLIDGGGCETKSSFTLTEPDSVKLIIKKILSLTCNSNSTGGVEVDASGGNSAYSFMLKGGGIAPIVATNGIFGNLPASNSYTLRVSDTNGCADSSNVVITQPDSLKINLSNRNGTIVNCPGNRDTIWVAPYGGTYPYSLIPESGSGAEYFSKGFALCNQPDGAYRFTISDKNGCSKADSAVISSIPGPIVSLDSIVNATCDNVANGSIAISTISQAGIGSVIWDGFSSRDTVLNGLSRGVYWVTVTDVNKCSFRTSFTVGAPAPIVLSLEKHRDPKCFGFADGNIGVSANGGHGMPYTYQWLNSKSEIISQVDSTGAIPSGVYNVIASDSIGCQNSASYTIVDPPSVTPNLPNVVTICVNQTYVADAGIPNVSYQWSSDNGFTSTLKVDTLKQPGNYYLTIIDGNGCVGQDTLRVDGSSSKIDANFMVAEKASVGDTLVIIEMSWPAPEYIEWNYPAAFQKVYDNDYSVYLVPQMEGTYNIGLASYVGPCSEYIEKTILIVAAKGDEGKVSTAEPLIRNVNLFPNPNKGDFSVDIDLSREAETLVELYSFYGQRIRFEKVTGLSKYSVNINQRLLPGIYLVRVTAGNETRSLRVVVQ